MKIEHTSIPAKEDIDYLTKMINQETMKFGEAFPFAFFIRNKNEQIISGCNGYVIFGCIYTDQLWVDPNYRNQGFAKNLINKVHEYVLEQGCKIDFERKGYTKAASCLFLRKEL